MNTINTIKIINNKGLVYVSCLNPFLFVVPFVITIALGFPTTAAGASANNGGNNQQLELGFVKQMFDNAGGGRGAKWVEKFCDLALSLKGKEYERFLKLARLEAVPVTEEERKNRPTGASDLAGYMSSAVDRIRVNQCLEHGGEAASREAQLDLYWLITSERLQFEAAGYKWLRKSADRGEPMAQFRLSELIMKFGVLSGKPMPETPPEIMEEGTPERYLFWMKRAAEGGLPIAQLELARFHTIKWPREAAHLANEVEGLKWLERAATQSTDGRSRYNAAAILGGFYFRGDIVPQDYQRALRWFNVVVDEKRGEFWGCGSLGGAVRSYLIRMYQERLGVEKDPTKVEYYSRTPRNVCI